MKQIPDLPSRHWYTPCDPTNTCCPQVSREHSVLMSEPKQYQKFKEQCDREIKETLPVYTNYCVGRTFLVDTSKVLPESLTWKSGPDPLTRDQGRVGSIDASIRVAAKEFRNGEYLLLEFKGSAVGANHWKSAPKVAMHMLNDRKLDSTITVYLVQNGSKTAVSTASQLHALL